MRKKYYQFNENNAKDVVYLSKNMKENFQLQQISNDDVVGCDNGTHKIARLIQVIKEIFTHKINAEMYSTLTPYDIKILSSSNNDKGRSWFDRGVSCEVLKVGAQSWQKGKIRLNISLEFIPDETIDNSSKSELDDLRQAIGQNN
jgi:hypothetical protein